MHLGRIEPTTPQNIAISDTIWLVLHLLNQENSLQTTELCRKVTETQPGEALQLI
jgi:hypothetical protein